LSTMRSQRKQLALAESELRQTSDRLSHNAWGSRGEIMTILGDDAFGDGGEHPIKNLGEFVDAQLAAHREPLVEPPLVQLKTLIERLIMLRERAGAWRKRFDSVESDFDHERTMGRARALITQLHGVVNAAQGSRRLDEATKYRRWRSAQGVEAQRLA